MSDTPQIIVVGSHAPGMFVRVKRVPLAGETVIGWDFREPVDGGKGSNQAIAAARLGAHVSFVGCVGKDRIGEDGARWMRDAGVDLRHLRTSTTTGSGAGFVILDERGIPAMVTTIGANAEVQKAQIDAALNDFGGASVLLTQFEIDPQVALYAAQSARQRGMIAIVNPAPAPETPLDGLEAATILAPNESEAKILLGLPADADVAHAELAKTLQKRSGAQEVVITLGSRGAIGTDGTDLWNVEPPAVRVVDTSGAGDLFCAALAVALVEGKSIREAAGWACVAASLSVSRIGTIPSYPTRIEVDGFVKGLNSL